MSSNRPTIPALTGVRFFAAIHVVFFHYAPPMPGVARNFVDNGYMAVGLFFVLSGFVLAYNYAGRAVVARRFWTARFARIYPAYFAAFLLIAPAVVARHLHHPGKLAGAGLAAVGLLQGWIPGLALIWNGPGWSLSNEAFFYLLFPFVLPILAGLEMRGLWMVCGISWVAALIPPTALGGETATYFPLFRLSEFVMGVIAGLMFVERRHVAGWVLPAISAALAGFAMFSNEWIPASIRGAVAAPLFAILVFALAANRGWVQRWLAWRPLYRLGEASYAVYILQSPVMAYWLLATQGASASAARTPLGWAAFLVYTVVLLVVSLACNLYLEDPARRWILSRRTPARHAVAA